LLLPLVSQTPSRAFFIRQKCLIKKTRLFPLSPAAKPKPAFGRLRARAESKAFDKIGGSSDSAGKNAS